MTPFRGSDALLQRVVSGARRGATFGAVLMAVGVLRMLFALVVGDLSLAHLVAHPVRDALLVALYVGGFALAGAVIGAGWGLASGAVGTYVLGYLAAAVCSTIIAFIAASVEETREPLPFYVVTVGIMTLVFGTGTAIVLRGGGATLSVASLSPRKKFWYAVAAIASAVLLWLDIQFHLVNR